MLVRGRNARTRRMHSPVATGLGEKQKWAVCLACYEILETSDKFENTRFARADILVILPLVQLVGRTNWGESATRAHTRGCLLALT